MSPFDTRQVSDQLIKLPEFVFALVIAQSLVAYRVVIVDPFPRGNLAEHSVAVVALFVVYFTTVMSWYDWHLTMVDRPYDMRRYGRTEWVRLGADMGIVVLYAYLLFTIAPFQSVPSADIWRHLLGYPLVFVVYWVSGVTRRRTYGPQASNLKPILEFMLALALLAVFYRAVWRLAPATWLNIVSLLSFLFVVWWYRRERKAETRRRREAKDVGCVVGIDIDGVLGNQIDGVIPRVRDAFSISLEYDEIVDWRYDFGPSDISTEIGKALTDKDYVDDMPLHQGARQMVATLFPHHRIVVITARPPETRQGTEQWLHKRRLFYDQMVNTREAGKSICAADVLVDDYIGNVIEFLDNSTGQAILVRRPWNADDAELASYAAAGRLQVVEELSDVPSAVGRFAVKSPR